MRQPPWWLDADTTVVGSQQLLLILLTSGQVLIFIIGIVSISGTADADDDASVMMVNLCEMSPAVIPESSAEQIRSPGGHLEVNWRFLLLLLLLLQGERRLECSAHLEAKAASSTNGVCCCQD